MRKILPLFLFMAMCLPGFAKVDNCFSLDTLNSLKTIGPMNIVTNKSLTFKVSANDLINGLSIDGSFIKTDEKYFLRILLKDIYGKDYLVMESYNEINDDRDVVFSNYCEETAYINSIQPDSIKIIATGVVLRLDKIHYISNKDFLLRGNAFVADSARSIRRHQVEKIIKKINVYNYNHDKLWRADVTSLSLASYADKKRILGLDDNCCSGGVEYYAEGIFEIGDINDSERDRPSISSYVDSFDWRNRHGKNWITPNKDQGDSGFCAAFTAVGVVEALARLYYNQLIIFDLSEQEAACCNGTSNPWNGMTVSAPLNYIRDYGVCDEIAYPFVNDSLESLICRSSTITPNELVTIGGYSSVTRNEGEMKSALINHGPLASSVRYWVYNPDQTHYNISHAMPIVGFGQLHEGDTIYHWVESDGHFNGAYTVRPGDPRIGETYWIYKNSYGTDHDTALNGYMHFIHYNYSYSVGSTYYCLPSVTTMNYSDSDIVCEDADGDGYYYWGIGPKPSWCPSWVPDTPDGDDSNINHGSLDNYGNLTSLPAGITIKTSVTYSSNSSTSYRLGIVDGGTLTITGTTSMIGNGKIRVCEGGKLIIDGGTLQNADITMVPGCTVIVRNNGKINMATGKDFNAPIGVIVNIESGEIN
ncbi:MAG: hypothetical protein J6W38_05410 [Prevotella sp.]|nr:hypothetical protein [Prevotella sp.]